MFSLKEKFKVNRMKKELKDANVKLGKYMYTDILDIVSSNDRGVSLEQSIESSTRYGREVSCNTDNFRYETVFSIQEGDELIPLHSLTNMVKVYGSYRSDLRNNDSVIGFPREVDYDILADVDIIYVYSLYQDYQKYLVEEKHKEEVYALKKVLK